MEMWEIYKSQGGYSIAWGIWNGGPIIDSRWYETIGEAFEGFKKQAEKWADVDCCKVDLAEAGGKRGWYCAMYKKSFDDIRQEEEYFDNEPETDAFLAKISKGYIDELLTVFAEINA